MKRAFVFVAFIVLFILSGCKKGNPVLEANLEGTWNYSGYEGGLAGLRFTPVNSEGPYIQIKGSQFLITTGVGHAQKCMHFTLIKDSISNLYQVTGILTVSDTSFMLPMPNFTHYLVSLYNDQFSLAPFQCNDCYTISYRRISTSFKWCN